MADAELWSRLGALPEPDGTRFTVWAPLAERLELVVEQPAPPPDRRRDAAPREPSPRDHAPREQRDPEPGTFALRRAGAGLFTRVVRGVGPGTRYRLRIDGRGPFPDPASRFQPQGVHGPSQVIDPRAFPWSDAGWRGRPLEQLVLYELHAGTFTPQGTFAAAIAKLPHLVELGITAIQLMPVAEFPGDRNWGYDGAALFAPTRCYGAPDDLRRLVDAAHAHGLAVHLDLVLNHLGPDGAYVVAFAPAMLAKDRPTGWGAGMNLDGPHSAGVREFLIRNAIHWVSEYHLDGLRLDATPALRDASPRHFLAELGARVRAAAAERPVVVVAEDVRNLATLVRPEPAGGFGLDATWSFDFHHQLHRMLTGDTGGYFVDFEDSAANLATIVGRGWLHAGQPSRFWGGPRGTDPSGIPPPRFVFYLQNHDEVGNRSSGERLHHRIDPAAWRAALTLLLTAPQTPLLFMGQEWAAGTPFRFFTHHHAALGDRIAAGRRRELARLGELAHAGSEVPHPQEEETFETSRLCWDELARAPHAAALALHRALLRLRKTEPAVRGGAGAHRVEALDPATLVLRREAPGHPAIVAVVRLRDQGTCEGARGAAVRDLAGRPWAVVLHTEAPEFADPPLAMTFGPGRNITFARPGAVVFRVE